MHETREHWFSFGDGYLAVSECFPKSPAPIEQTLFFLHGRFGHAGIWRPLAHRLASRFRCFQVDLPGFGRSLSCTGRALSLLEHSQIVRALMSRISRESQRAVLVGHDMGGAIAQLCALHEPQSVAALVLINSAAVTAAPHSFGTGFLGIQARLNLRRMLKAASPNLRPEHRQLLLATWRNRLSRLAQNRAFAMWRSSWPDLAERKAWAEGLSKLSQPILLLWGVKDPLNLPESASELLRQFPDAYLFEHEECGHWPSLEADEWVDTKMREFLFNLREQPPLRHIA